MVKRMDVEEQIEALQARVAAQGRMIAFLFSKHLQQHDEMSVDSFIADFRRLVDRKDDHPNALDVEECVDALLDHSKTVVQRDADRW